MGVPNTTSIVKFNQDWVPTALGTGLNSSSRAVTSYRNELIVGGTFNKAGGIPTGYWARWHPTCPRGDMNCDNLVNDADISPFVSVLLAPNTASDCQKYLADMNGDGNEDGGDIPQFIAALE
jgi:hypothetical protein